MKSIGIITLFTLIGITACKDSDHSSRYPNDSYHGMSHRSVMYFAPSHDEKVKEFLLGVLTNECALQERDVVTLVITEDGFSFPGWAKDMFDYSALIKTYGINRDEHAAVLIGKDGSEKLRWGAETDWNLVTKTIDAMPMRQAEMKRAASRCSI
ncbi:hypothetical protein VTH8203_03986 [Vibrio thalassae]|uniref:DUF4174 domain-containing protein n=1 Tax=Vibrio thalassae TaxID=1243014 RepID=A0A240EP79_9VIBR|nr:DUF4174 domain-containing protein [Vibrio thalassae]SNX50331.1 hypothetical protein VTH8203_03986 [Vibrio thalassae]